jgi:hypothetical protein
MCKEAPRNYFVESKPKKNGGHRVIYKPRSWLKAYQKKLNKRLSKLPILNGICGGPGTSIMDAMAPHCDNPLLLTIDLKDFFPSIGHHRVRALFEEILDDETLATAFTMLCTSKLKVPQGAPTSATIARQMIQPAFVDLKKALYGIHPSCKATVWVDDIVISGPAGLRKSKGTVVRIFERHEFVVNERKTKIMFAEDDRDNLGLTLCDFIYPSADTLEKYETCKRDTPWKVKTIAGYLNFFKDINKANMRCTESSEEVILLVC